MAIAALMRMAMRHRNRVPSGPNRTKQTESAIIHKLAENVYSICAFRYNPSVRAALCPLVREKRGQDR
jgi:hypothetical protein